MEDAWIEEVKRQQCIEHAIYDAQVGFSGKAWDNLDMMFPLLYGEPQAIDDDVAVEFLKKHMTKK